VAHPLFNSRSRLKFIVADARTEILFPCVAHMFSFFACNILLKYLQITGGFHHRPDNDVDAGAPDNGQFAAQNQVFKMCTPCGSSWVDLSIYVHSMDHARKAAGGAVYGHNLLRGTKLF